MQAHEQSDGTLVLTYDSGRLSVFVTALAALPIAVLGYDYVVGTSSTDRLIGLLVAAGTCLFVAVVILERVHVLVNPATRTIIWTCKWGFQHRAGSLSFDQVDTILAESPVGDDGVPSRRLVLRAKDGRTIPLTVSYRTDADGTILQASEHMRSLLGDRAPTPTLGSVQALVSAGHVIAAIKLLRETEGVPLEEAKRQVDALKAKQ